MILFKFSNQADTPADFHSYRDSILEVMDDIHRLHTAY